MTTVGEHERYSFIHRVGVDTSFRHHRSVDGALSLIGRVGFDTSFAKFHSAKDLNSRTHALNLTEQVRFRDPNVWIAPSLTLAVSDARVSQYSYGLARMMLSAQASFESLGMTSESLRDILLRATLSRTYIDFHGKDSIQTTRVRNDIQDGIALGLTKPLTSWAALVVDGAYTTYDSNIRRYDYTSKMISGGVRVNF